MVKEYSYIINLNDPANTSEADIIRYFKTGAVSDFIRENNLAEITTLSFRESLTENQNARGTKTYNLKIVGYEKIHKE